MAFIPTTDDAALATFSGAAGAIARLMGRQAARAAFAEIEPLVAANIITAVIAAAALVYFVQCYFVQP